MSPAEPHEDGPGRADADAFESIVAGWRAEGAVPSWPDERPPPPRPEAERADRTHPAGPRRVAPPEPEDDHFVPPEPPPLPRLDRAAAIGVAVLGSGLVLLLAPEVLGIAEAVGTSLGLLVLAGGIGWLVLRTWSKDPRPGDGRGEDDGAVF